jgi:hypothetical protein
MATEKSEDYQRFEALTRRLAQVPKKEIDDLEKAESSRTDQADKPSDDASEDSQA